MDTINLVSSLEKREITKKDIIITSIQLPLLGITIGFLITLFLYIANVIIDFSIKSANEDLVYLIIFLSLIFVVSVISTTINKKIPGYIGNGISRLTSYYNGNNDFNPYLLMGFTFVNSLLALLYGFTLNVAAPSVTIGASISSISNRILHKHDRDIVMSGGSASFAVVFLSPLAGLCHLLEEHRHRISKKFIIKGLVVILFAYSTSYLISRFVWDREIFYFLDIKRLPFNMYNAILSVSLLSFIVGQFYVEVKKRMKKLKGNKIMMFLTPILAVSFIVLIRFRPYSVGNGANVLKTIFEDETLFFLISILIVRFVLMQISESSFVSGGIVLPLMVLGAIMGDIIVWFFNKQGSTLYGYEDTIKAIGMFTCLGCAANIPLAALILGFESTRSVYILLPLGISIIFEMIFKFFLNLPFKYNFESKTEFSNNDIV